jgi:hypothetical protein
MDVVRPDTTLCALDEEGIPGRNIVSERGPPKVVVAVGLENGRDLGSSSPKGGNLHEHVNDWLSGEARNGGAAEVLDAADETLWKASKQMRRLLPKKLRPTGVVANDNDILLDSSLHPLFEGFHPRKNEWAPVSRALPGHGDSLAPRLGRKISSPVAQNRRWRSLALRAINCA